MAPMIRLVMRVVRSSLATCALLAPWGAAQADTVFTALLSGAGERPVPTSSAAAGSATVTYETVANGFRYVIDFNDLTAPATMSHIHFGGPDAAGPVVLPFPGVPAATSATISGLLTQADLVNTAASGLSTVEQILQQGLLGNLYVNVHTTSFPAGEIRGQLLAAGGAVSTPGTLALLGIAMVGVGMSIRRKDP